MGWLLLLVTNFLGWLDRRAERPLLQAVQDLEDLLLEPRTTLSRRPVVIGPARKYGSALFLGLAVALAAWALLLGLFLLPVPGLGARPAGRGPFLLGAFAVLLLGSFLLMLRLMRGGHLVLTERGVELRHRGTAVFCPWALFNTPGQPFRAGAGDLLVLPVAPGAVAAVEERRDDLPVATGEGVRARQFQFRSAREAQLRAFYEVNPVELGKVLLHLGRALGDRPPQAPPPLDVSLPEAPEAEPAGAGEGGWLTVSLTRLTFPPACCDCGAARPGRQKFTAYEPLLSAGRLLHPVRREAVHVWVPVCYACQAANRQRFQAAVVSGVSVGVGVVVLAYLSVFLWPNHIGAALVFIAAVLFGPFLGGLVGYRVGKARAEPVRLRDYLPGRGTVAIRFRRPEYGEQLQKVMRAAVGT